MCRLLAARGQKVGPKDPAYPPQTPPAVVVYISRSVDFPLKAAFTFAPGRAAGRRVMVSYGLAVDGFGVRGALWGGVCLLRGVAGRLRAAMGATRAGGKDEDEQGQESVFHCGAFRVTGSCGRAASSARRISRMA